ncbi:MAG: hypothetical protein IT210_00495 [Armatimonadetes bacterium]|nr:hypothetical protein [Armatimonadota bacterium]
MAKQSESIPAVAVPVTEAPVRDIRRPRLNWLRAILLGLVLQAIVIIWIANTEIPGKVFISSWSIIMPAVLLLLMLIPVNALVARRHPQLALTRNEMLVSYIMIGVSAVITGYCMIQVLIPAMGAPFHHATPENRWADLHRIIPAWLTIRDSEALKGLFRGNSPVPWSVWLLPLGAWLTFMIAFFGAMLCTGLLLSRQWITAERLSFPIVSVPLEMTSERASLFKNKLMWIGFFLPVFFESLLALNYWFPWIPAIEMKHRSFDHLFPNRPWQGGITPIVWGFTPFVAGFAFLAPVDISFSVWFFFVLSKASKVFGVYMGWDAPTAGSASQRFPYPVEQSVGAFLAFGGFALWRSYPALKKAILSGIRRNGDSQDEVGINRIAVLGLGVCAVYLIVFLYIAGLSPHWSVGMIALCLLIAIALARIRAETGTAWAFGPYRNPSQILVNSFGTQAFSAPSLTMLGMIQWFYIDPRFLPMAHQMEAFKMGDSVHMNRGKLAAVIALATATGIILGYYACLAVSYRLGWDSSKVYGAGVWISTLQPNQVKDWMNNPVKPDWIGFPWMAGGAIFTLALLWARQAFMWWPFHPVGYVLAETGTSYSFWFHYFVAWLFKMLILRYGGMKLYLKVLPFVVGVILGDIIAQTVWSAGACLLGIPVYQFVS